MTLSSFIYKTRSVLVFWVDKVSVLYVQLLGAVTWINRGSGYQGINFTSLSFRNCFVLISFIW